MDQKLGDYKLIKLIGHGVLGKVYMAEHLFLKRYATLKVLKPQVSEDRAFVSRFEKEISSVAGIDHPHIAKIHSVSFYEGKYFLVTDFIPGPHGEPMDLNAYVREQGHHGALKESIVLQLALQLSGAIDAIHTKTIGGEPITHLAIKPANILVTKMVTQPDFVLTDAGITRIVGTQSSFDAILEEMHSDHDPRAGAAKAHHRERFVQNYHFLAPEQKIAQEEELPSYRSDAYSFGVLVYYLLMGEYPEGVFELPSLHRELVLNWDQLIMRLLKKDPRRRAPHRPGELLSLVEEMVQKQREGSRPLSSSTCVQNDPKSDPKPQNLPAGNLPASSPSLAISPSTSSLTQEVPRRAPQPQREQVRSQVAHQANRGQSKIESPDLRSGFPPIASQNLAQSSHKAAKSSFEAGAKAEAKEKEEKSSLAASSDFSAPKRSSTKEVEQVLTDRFALSSERAHYAQEDQLAKKEAQILGKASTYVGALSGMPSSAPSALHPPPSSATTIPPALASSSRDLSNFAQASSSARGERLTPSFDPSLLTSPDRDRARQPGTYRLPTREIEADRKIEPIQSEMVQIAGGEYVRGSNDGSRDEMPIHKVHIRDFAIDVHPVTNQQFLQFLQYVGAEKDAYNHDMIRLKESRIKRAGGRWSVEAGYAKHPIVGVTWYGARAYCQWVGKRLPTEAEWEVAAKGGEEHPYPCGEKIEKTQANFFNSDTTAVMSYPPNPYGLYDMSGNVYEWCQDWYAYNTYELCASEPMYPCGPPQGVYRVLRGGCWKSLKEDLRSAHRHRNNPGAINRTYGFRCAQNITQEGAAGAPRVQVEHAPIASGLRVDRASGSRERESSSTKSRKEERPSQEKGSELLDRKLQSKKSSPKTP